MKDKPVKCKSENCEEEALFFAEYCWPHLADKKGYAAHLLKAVAEGHNLSGCNFKKIVLTHSSLEKAHLGRANLSQSDLSGTHLFDSNLKGADLVGTNLNECELTNCNLAGADLTKAKLVNARAWNADLRGANLTECDMNGADFWNAHLFDSKLWHTVFENAKFLSMQSFSANTGVLDNSRVNEAGLLSAKESYRDLKKYFLSNGMYDDAGWAAFKEKTMERLVFKKNRDLNYFPSLVMSALCGYGEKPYRIVLSGLLTIFLFAFLYASLNAMQSSTRPDYALNLGDCIYVSTITFTTVGYGDFIPRDSTGLRLLAACEAFMGVFLTGLFIFTLARKYSAR